MAVNWSDTNDVQAFRAAALKQPGADPNKIDQYITSKASTVMNTPQSPQAAAISQSASAPQINEPIKTEQKINAPSVPEAAAPLIPAAQDNALMQAAQQKKAAEAVKQQETQPQPSPAPEALPPTQPGKTQEQIMAETGQQFTLDNLGKQGVDVSQPVVPQIQPQAPQVQEPQIQEPQAPLITPSEGSQGTILGKTGKLGTAAGVRQSADVFSGGINRGRDVAVANGTPLAAPAGNWTVVDAYGARTQTGKIGDKTNYGYGNSVVLQNKDTGEKIRMSHLSPGVNVKTGQEITGGTVIGATGQTGNTTGPHLDIEYFDSKGKLRDIMNSPYGKYLMP